jgi:hypothetical protein
MNLTHTSDTQPETITNNISAISLSNIIKKLRKSTDNLQKSMEGFLKKLIIKRKEIITQSIVKIMKTIINTTPSQELTQQKSSIYESITLLEWESRQTSYSRS